MKKRVLFLSLGLLMLTLSTALRAACPLTSLENQLAGKTTVFVGVATSQRVVPANGTSTASMMTETAFEVDDVWKGDLESVAQVRTCSYTLGNEHVTCSEDFSFSVGTRYIVFANGMPLQTNGCYSTARLDSVEGSRIMAWLADKPHHEPR
jgi:hypothetical protein